MRRPAIVSIGDLQQMKYVDTIQQRVEFVAEAAKKYAASPSVVVVVVARGAVPSGVLFAFRSRLLCVCISPPRCAHVVIVVCVVWCDDQEPSIAVAGPRTAARHRFCQSEEGRRYARQDAG